MAKKCPGCGTPLAYTGAPIHEDYCPNKACTYEFDRMKESIRKNMAKKPNGGPAFPGTGEYGMNKRQYYASQALAGIMANPERWRQIAADYEDGRKTYQQCSEANALKAWSLADALIATEDAVVEPKEKKAPF